MLNSEMFNRLVAKMCGITNRSRKRLNDAVQASRRRNRRRNLGFEMLEGRRLLVASLSINDVSITEGNSGTGASRFMANAMNRRV